MTIRNVLFENLVSGLPLFVLATTHLLGCMADPRPTGSPAGYPRACDGGFVLDGEACVPERCGTGRWGDLPVDEASLFVDATASPLEDAQFKPAGPFVEALGREGARRAMILNLLSGRKEPEVLEAARGLASNPDRLIADAARELLLRAGEKAPMGNEWLDEKTGIVLVRIPAGRFWMGSTREEQDQVIEEWVRVGVERDLAETAARLEAPRHEVTIVSDFWMARHPVTNEQYARFLSANPEHAKPKYWDDSRYNLPQQPVVGVSLPDVVAFSTWAGMRLPTEPEWENSVLFRRNARLAA